MRNKSYLLLLAGPLIFACSSWNKQHQLEGFKNYPKSKVFAKDIQKCGMFNPAKVPPDDCYYSAKAEKRLSEILTDQSSVEKVPAYLEHYGLRIASQQLVSELRNSIQIGIKENKGYYGGAIPFLVQQAVQLKAINSIQALTELLQKNSWQDLGATKQWDVFEFYKVAGLFERPETISLLVNQVPIYKSDSDFSGHLYEILANQILIGTPLMQTVQSQLARTLESIYPDLVPSTADAIEDGQAELLSVKMNQKLHLQAASLYLTVTDRTLTQIRNLSAPQLKPVAIASFPEKRSLFGQSVTYYLNKNRSN